MLLTARQYRGYSQSFLSKDADINQSYYSKIENGLASDNATEETVQKIADSLDFPLSFFYQQDQVMGLPISVHPMYRKSARIKDSDLSQLNAELNIRIFHLRRLLNAVELDPELELPQYDVEETGSAAKIAEMTRKAWGLPNGPIQNLTELVEQAGCLVVWCDFDIPVDGVTVKFRDMPHCIFLNKSAPPDRMRFSLAHELGHIIMHKIPTDTMEQEANDFASEFLMPEKDIKHQLKGKLTIVQLARLKLVWRASMQAILYRANKIGAISKNQYDYLIRKISANGWKIREPEDTDFPYEQPSTSTGIIEMHSEDFEYSKSDFLELLNINQNDLRRFYQDSMGAEPRPSLRLVV